MRLKATKLLPELRRTLQDLVTVIRTVRLNSGIAFEGFTYDSDLVSNQNFTALDVTLSAGNPLPEGFKSRTADNQNVPNDDVSLGRMAAALMGFVNRVYSRS